MWPPQQTRIIFVSPSAASIPASFPRLRNLLPAITPGEEHLCMMIKLNMTVREIARMLNIDVKSVHTARARLKRKLPLDADTTMDQWIKKIDN